MSRPHQLVCMHAAFYNVGIQTAQLDATVQRHEEHMRRLESDVAEIVRSLPALVALHLCEFGGHGGTVPEHVRGRITQRLGSGWSVVWDNNYVVCWKPARLRMVEQPALQEVPTKVRAHGDSSNPHTFQMYTCEIEGQHGRSGLLKVIHVHHRSSKAHKWTSGSQGRGLTWLRELTADSSAWLIGGDLNTPSYQVGQKFQEATCVLDSRERPHDLALAHSSLNPGTVTCRVGKHFQPTASISDAHSAVAIELHLPNVSPATGAETVMVPPPSKVPPPPKRSAPSAPLAMDASAASRASGPVGTMGAPSPPAMPLFKPPAAMGHNINEHANVAAPPPSAAMPPPAMPLVQSVPKPPPAADWRPLGLGDITHVTTPPPSTQSSHVDTPPPSSCVDTPPPSSRMSTPELPPVETQPKIVPPPSAAMPPPAMPLVQSVPKPPPAADWRPLGLGDITHLRAHRVRMWPHLHPVRGATAEQQNVHTRAAARRDTAQDRGAAARRRRVRGFATVWPWRNAACGCDARAAAGGASAQGCIQISSRFVWSFRTTGGHHWTCARCNSAITFRPDTASARATSASTRAAGTSASGTISAGTRSSTVSASASSAGISSGGSSWANRSSGGDAAATPTAC